MAQETASNVWTRVVVITASGLATIAFVLVAFVGSEYLRRVASLESVVSGMGLSIAECRIHTEEHNRAAEGHIDNIAKNTANVNDLRQRCAESRVRITSLEGEIQKQQLRVEALYSSGGPAKRFTSDDGDELREEVHTNRDDIHYLKDKVHEFELKLKK